MASFKDELVILGSGRIRRITPTEYTRLLAVEGCENAAHKLFLEIREHHGDAEARRIFLKFGRPPSARKMGKIRNYALLDRHDMMKPKPNVKALARELAKENETLPREERHGPRGSTDPFTQERQIKRLLKERKAALKKGTWWGPIFVP
jgi:hypothetical protein